MKNLLNLKPARPFADAPERKSARHVVDGISILDEAPIADHYPETTVFFADLVGMS